MMNGTITFFEVTKSVDPVVVTCERLNIFVGSLELFLMSLQRYEGFITKVRFHFRAGQSASVAMCRLCRPSRCNF